MKIFGFNINSFRGEKKQGKTSVFGTLKKNNFHNKKEKLNVLKPTFNKNNRARKTDPTLKIFVKPDWGEKNEQNQDEEKIEIKGVVNFGKNEQKKQDLAGDLQVNNTNFGKKNSGLKIYISPNSNKNENLKNENNLKKRSKKLFNFGKTGSNIIWKNNSFLSFWQDLFKKEKMSKKGKKLHLYLEFFKLKLTSKFFWQDSYKKLFKFILYLLTIFIIYLSVFDHFFYIKNYEIQVEKNSFISKKQTELVIEKIANRKLFGLIPLNNRWFINDLALKQVLRDTPELNTVKNIDLKEKIWPNKIVVNLQSRQVLATLAIKVDGQTKYMAFDKNGDFLGFDNENLRINLLNVNSPLFYTGSRIEEDLSLNRRPKQLEKIWFVFHLKNWLKNLNFDYSQISISSLSDYDNEVIVTGLDGVKLLFDMTMFSPQNQQKRLEGVLKDPQIATHLNKGEISYIDFRVDKKVFWCFNSEACSIRKND